jgi:2,4'-dihydroxyacetophenone dioxygenase
MVEAGLMYLDKPANGAFAAYKDGFSALEIWRKYYRQAGLDGRRLDLLIR